MIQKTLSESIETQRLRLRRLKPEMAGDLFEGVNRDRRRLEQNMPWLPVAKNLTEQTQSLETSSQRWVALESFEYGIFGKDTGYHMGVVGAYGVDWSNERCELGYWILSQYEGNGYVSEAIAGLANHLFDFGFIRLEIRCSPENERSARVPIRLGFQFEGQLKANKKLPSGQFHDSLIFARVSSPSRVKVSEQKRVSRPPCIRHFSEILSSDDSHYPGSDELLSYGAALGKATGLQRIGVHYEILKPGRRTSWPHAESTEEEFVYVVSGLPNAWINGHLYPLRPGDAVGFPAGTGIAHTFINDSDREAVLIVVGEATKKDNKCIYPLHPKRNEEIGEFLWKDCPQQSLGPHDGLPITNLRKAGEDA